MIDFIVTRKSDGSEVFRYQAPAPVEWSGMEFATHEHTETVAPTPQPAPDRNISGVSYLRRFTQNERIAIRAAATQSPIIDYYLKLLDATIAQGGIINLNDPDTITACTMLEQAGLIASGRSAEVLA